MSTEQKQVAAGRGDSAGSQNRAWRGACGCPRRHGYSDPHRAGCRGRQVYAALDLGTNNCRLLIARPCDNGFKIVDSFSRIIRLGEGLSATGQINEQAMERCLDALRVCCEKMAARGTTRARTIATEVCRAAMNADDFCKRVARELGLLLEIVDRETEARLAAAGCMPLVDEEARGAIVFDIGGGSSEVVRVDRRNNGKGDRDVLTVSGWSSVPLGVVTLAERHGGRAVTPDIYRAMMDDVSGHLTTFARDHARDLDDLHLLGTSGTVTTVAGIHLGLAQYDRRRVDGIWMSEGEIEQTVARLKTMSFDELAENGCIGHARADLVLAGCAILDAIRQLFPCPRLRVADRGLREGMLVEMMREDGVLPAYSPGAL